MALEQRLKKLEAVAKPEQEPMTIFVSYVSPGGPSVLSHAMIPGSDFDYIPRDGNESEEDFKQRVEAMRGEEMNQDTPA